MYMDKNYIIYPKDSYTQIEGIDRGHLTQQYMFAQLSLMQQFTELFKIQGRKEMKNQNFYMRVISLLLVILAVLFYNSSMKAQANEKEIAALTDKVDTLQEQQNELLSALETSYVNRMQNQAVSAGSGSSDADTAGDDKTTDTSDGNVSDADAEDTATADSDNVYKDGTYTGEAEGYGGTIQVEVTLTGDEITSINVVSAPGEDSAYLSQAESVIDSILSAQSTDVDTVSGATFSSTGILNAVDAALGKAENS